jgi:hypothetical protein
LLTTGSDLADGRPASPLVGVSLAALAEFISFSELVVVWGASAVGVGSGTVGFGITVLHFNTSKLVIYPNSKKV